MRRFAKCAPLALALLCSPLFLARSGRAAEPAAAPAHGEKTAEKAGEKLAEHGEKAGGKGEKVVGPPEVAWKDMTAEQKGRFMKMVVTPKMKVAFQEFDADQFKKFNCGTCHGKDAREKKFKMPNPEIHSLPGTPEAFKAEMAKKPEWKKWTDFMGGKVVPEMAAMLGMPKFDPKAPDPNAFGCARCHVIEGKK